MRQFVRTPTGAALTLVGVAAILVVAIGLTRAPGSYAATSQGAYAGPVEPVPTWTFTPTRPPQVVLAPTATPTGTATPTALPPTPTWTPAPTATPTPFIQPPQVAVTLTGLRHMWQTWNNCGPATLAMALSYYGSSLDQADIAAVLRRHPDDKNVAPQELADFARSQGYRALVRVNGNAQLLRTFLSNGIPVVLETWLEPEPNDGMGHYRLLVGYDDAAQHWIAYDSYVSDNLVAPADAPYQGIYLSYAETEALWAVFNRTYILIYQETQEPLIQQILGEQMDDAVMWQTARQSAEAVVGQRPDDPFAWFNLGTDLVALQDFDAAALAYDRARALGLPWRMLWYQFGPFQAYHAVGRYGDVVALADATLATTQSIEEIHYWKGQGLAGLGDLAGARAAWQQALSLNPAFAPAQEALASLPR
ncbi:C39 family peptidase [Litorilinea aerophila]|uniref:Tetratricopeptide repeat protein n=1 Tax=Litorilinea aerophila TaxID=1204385 RepID=A0A540VHF3_9CHLR|nr:C39 family peptidase [Litorilinea aerophila]MCC9076251.1 C39 family peptidase [Litorilinea aerophila]